jgi:hypothetical protein
MGHAEVAKPTESIIGIASRVGPTSFGSVFLILVRVREESDPDPSLAEYFEIDHDDGRVAQCIGRLPTGSRNS